MKTKRIGAGVFGLLLFAVICGAAPQTARAAACSAASAAPLAIDQIRGIRTKWASYARDRRNSIAPDLAHLSLKEWTRDLEALGVNLAEINLEPQRKLRPAAGITSDLLKETLEAIYTPSSQRSPAQAARVAAFENEIAPNRQYSRQERDDVQLDFLRRLETLKRSGEIAGNLRFIIHQRLWFREGEKPNAARRRGRRAAEFAQDMATFIQRAEGECLGHWIAGIRLGEHSNRDMNELLPLIVSLAHEVNAHTGGWLKSHLFVVNGGGFGAEFRGVGHVAAPDGRPYPFFPSIAAETGAFAFGYKFEDFQPGHSSQGSDAHMAAASCAPQRACNPSSVADWQQYLGGVLGFDELAAFLKANAQRYPNDANVIFTGDAADAVVSMVQPGPEGKLVPRPSLAALGRLFLRAGPVATRAKIFMNGYSTAENMRGNYRAGGPIDIGRALYFVSDAGKATLLPQGKRIWADWPRE